MDIGLEVEVKGRTIHVRVDDLTPHEAGQVRKSIETISTIFCELDTGLKAGVTLGAILMIGTLISLIISSNIMGMTDNKAFFIMGFGLIVSGCMGFFSGMDRHDRSKVVISEHTQTLRGLMASSHRCKMFIKEYAQASGYLAEVLRSNAPATEPVTTP